MGKTVRFFPYPIILMKHTLQIVYKDYLEKEMLEYVVVILTFATSVIELLKTCLSLYRELRCSSKSDSQKSEIQEQDYPKNFQD
jgi:hypothetical protein